MSRTAGAPSCGSGDGDSRHGNGIPAAIIRSMTDPADAASQTTAASLVRGGLWTALSHVMPQLYILAVSIAAARFLGPDEFGRQSFIAFVGLSVQLLLTSGVGLA